MKYKEHSFEVKFDRKENFDSEKYFEIPEAKLSFREIMILGKTICDLIEFHYCNSNAEAYLFVAENPKLKRFYNRLVKKFAVELEFIVRSDLGEEELGYEIRTPSYKS